MNELLLDSHTFAWAVIKPARLSGTALAAVRDPTNKLVVSAASLWEMSIKHRLGRWPEAEPLIRQYDDVMARLGVTALAVSVRDGVRAGGLQWDHADPFDRMLAVQAMSTGAVLVTKDAVFRDLPGLSVLW